LLYCYRCFYQRARKPFWGLQLFPIYSFLKSKNIKILKLFIVNNLIKM